MAGSAGPAERVGRADAPLELAIRIKPMISKLVAVAALAAEPNVFSFSGGRLHQPTKAGTMASKSRNAPRRLRNRRPPFSDRRAAQAHNDQAIGAANRRQGALGRMKARINSGTANNAGHADWSGSQIERVSSRFSNVSAIDVPACCTGATKVNSPGTWLRC